MYIVLPFDIDIDNHSWLYCILISVNIPQICRNILSWFRSCHWNNIWKMYMHGLKKFDIGGSDPHFCLNKLSSAPARPGLILGYYVQVRNWCRHVASMGRVKSEPEVPVAPQNDDHNKWKMSIIFVAFRVLARSTQVWLTEIWYSRWSSENPILDIHAILGCTFPTHLQFAFDKWQLQRNFNSVLSGATSLVKVSSQGSQIGEFTKINSIFYYKLIEIELTVLTIHVLPLHLNTDCFKLLNSQREPD